MSLLDELAREAVSECERAIVQARKHFETGEWTPEGAGWETFFRARFREVLERHGLEPAPARRTS